MWSKPKCYAQDNLKQRVQLRGGSLVDFCKGGSDKRTQAREAEKSPLLGAVAWKQLVKTQQAGKGLVGAVVICELWRLAIAL
jgi:hypothetical protein